MANVSSSSATPQRIGTYQHQPKALIDWGKGDYVFLSAGAEAIKLNIRNSTLHFFYAVHFALEEDVLRIAVNIV